MEVERGCSLVSSPLSIRVFSHTTSETLLASITSIDSWILLKKQFTHKMSVLKQLDKHLVHFCLFINKTIHSLCGISVNLGHCRSDQTPKQLTLAPIQKLLLNTSADYHPSRKCSVQTTSWLCKNYLVPRTMLQFPTYLFLMPWKTNKVQQDFHSPIKKSIHKCSTIRPTWNTFRLL